MSPPAGQALTLGASERDVGALLVFNPKARARVVAETELNEIAVQMLFLAVLVHAFHAALEDAENSFRRRCGAR